MHFHNYAFYTVCINLSQDRQVAAQSTDSCRVHCRPELYMFGVSVSIIEPGGHFTNFLDKLPQNVMVAWDKLSPDLQQEYGLSYMQKGTVHFCWRIKNVAYIFFSLCKLS